MSLATQINALATHVANYLRDSVLPRLLPAGGTTGQVLAKSSATDYAVAWAAPSGGGGGSATQVTLTVAAVATTGYAEVVVTDAGVSPASKLFAAFVPELDAENDAEQLIDDRMQVHAVPEAGQVRFLLSAVGAFVGPFKVNYQVFA